jgi:RHS repeat-associated protein
MSISPLATKNNNGNILYQYWGTPGNLSNQATYYYDKLNRLVLGGTTANREYPIYDVMGNLSSMGRYLSGAAIDYLTYNYISGGNPTNQVQSITDASGSNSGLANGTTTYTYDGNGNELSATNTVNTAQNKSFTYNLLNLPLVATVPTGTITYTYDASGNKLRRVSTGLNNKTDYIAGIQYDGATTPALSFIQTEEGKAVPTTTGGYDYYYYLGDNLGNTRVTFDMQTGAAVQLQKDDYFPFGMEINTAITSPKNEYLYNKKELQEELQEYDYGARFYDPVIARWNTIDPLAEKSRRWSPYNYVENNPIRLIDPDGRSTESTPDPEVNKNETTRETFNYDKNSKLGEDIVTTTQVTTTVQKNDDGVELYSMTETTTTSGTVNADGKITDVGQSKSTTITVNSPDGPKTSNYSDKSKNVSLSKAPESFKKAIAGVSAFKKANAGKSPVQVVAEINQAHGNVANTISLWTGGPGTILGFAPHPVVKGIGGALSAIGSVAGMYGAIESSKTDPENLMLQIK